MWPEIRRPGARTPRSAPHRRYAPPPAQHDEAATASDAHEDVAGWGSGHGSEGRTDGRRRPWAAIYPGEPETCRRDLRHFLPILAHLGLFFALFKVYNVETRVFQRLVLFAIAALPVHYAAPFRWKKPLFVAVSVAALAFTFDAATSVAALGLAAVLIGVCYLPIAWGARAAIVASIAGLCALARSGAWAVDAVIPPHVWPLVATLFMFRMIVYLYELKHTKKPETLVDTLSYFFLLPNYYFWHFPVVDYRTMQRGYFARDVHETMRTGLQMMFRGTTHLLLYRLVYHRLIVPADEVSGPWGLALYLACNYLLYLHVSGQFHVACGMLHLFGFALPETHRHYFLASSFTDYWRRINIYWKDFMVRVVFNPVFFALKKKPQPVALAVATAVVFAVTWLLHAYQSFWLRGSWGFSMPDALFWGVLGLLVLVNVQLDARRYGARTSKADPSSPGELALRTARTAGTFVTLAVLWSLWSSPSLGAWVSLLGRGFRGG
jgi:alginate O-acetyltransferase complex protein AlgI